MLLKAGVVSKASGGKFIDGVKGAAIGIGISAAVEWMMTPLAKPPAGIGGSGSGGKIAVDSNGNPVESTEITGAFIEGDFKESSPFGNTGTRNHMGTDLVPLNADGSVCSGCLANSGTAGEVIYVGQARGFDPNAVVVATPGGNQIIYGHMQGVIPGISVGTSVTPSQALGIIGTEGTSTGIHLHVEVRQGTARFQGLRLKPRIIRDNPSSGVNIF